MILLGGLAFFRSQKGSRRRRLANSNLNMPAISVENLSKAYRIGMSEKIPDTLVGAMKGC